MLKMKCSVGTSEVLDQKLSFMIHSAFSGPHWGVLVTQNTGRD